jgi:hypothetical protein
LRRMVSLCHCSCVRRSTLERVETNSGVVVLLTGKQLGLSDNH